MDIYYIFKILITYRLKLENHKPHDIFINLCSFLFFNIILYILHVHILVIYNATELFTLRS